MSQTYLPLLVYDSLMRTGVLIDDMLAVKANKLQVEWQSYGRYWSLRYNQTCTQSVMEEWLNDGLGRHFELYTPGGTRIWEGFVDSVTANIGGLSVTRGPLIGQVANKIKSTFSTVDTSTTPPTMGIRDETDWATNAASQAKYGVLEQVMSVGGATLASAEQMRDTAIILKAEPPTSESDNLASSTVPAIDLTILGYMHWLKAYTIDLTTTGEQNADLKLQAVLGADPNSIFSTDYNFITSNAVQVGAYDHDLRVADSSVSGIVALGGTSNERWVLGFGPNRVCYYAPAPTVPKYARSLSDPSQVVRAYTMPQEVPLYDVGAAEWVFYTDFMAGRGEPADMTEQYTDPRYLFIERATLSLPAALTLQGGHSEELRALMAQKGLGGVKA